VLKINVGDFKVCGRFALAIPSWALAEFYELDYFSDFTPKYNIAPTQQIFTINKESNERVGKIRSWGLISSWSKEPKIGSKMINARSETVTEKPAFKSAFRYRRCLIPALGFYEWNRKEKNKQPYYIRMRDGTLFTFAGLWENWKKVEGKEIESCTILTTEANNVVNQIHDRMPVILRHEDFDLWLDSHSNIELLKPLLIPYSSEKMQMYPVNSYVNKTQNEDSKCIETI